MKVTVRIHKENGIVQFKKKKIDDDNRVTIVKKGKFRVGWRPIVKGYETRPLLFGRVKYFTDVWEGAPETWSYDPKKKPEDQPELTQKDIERIAKATIWERRYATEPKTVSGGLLYLILIVQIATAVLMFLLSSGRLKFG